MISVQMMEGTDTIAIDSTGKRTVYENLDSSDSCIVNRYLFTRGGNGRAIELSSRKAYKCVLDETSEVIYYLDGRYILRAGNKYASVGELELMGAEIA